MAKVSCGVKMDLLMRVIGDMTWLMDREQQNIPEVPSTLANGEMTSDTDMDFLRKAMALSIRVVG